LPLYQSIQLLISGLALLIFSALCLFEDTLLGIENMRRWLKEQEAWDENGREAYSIQMIIENANHIEAIDHTYGHFQTS